MTITYDTLYEKIQEKYDNGEYTFEQANILNDMAYTKYVTESVNKGSIVKLVLGTLAIIVPIAIKKRGDANYKKNLAEFPELKEVIDDMEACQKIMDAKNKEYESAFAKLSKHADEYNTMAETLGCPTITVREWETVPVSRYDAVMNTWYTEYIQQPHDKQQQNRNYNPDKAARIKNDLKVIEDEIKLCNSLLEDLKVISSKARTAMTKYKNILRKSKKRLEKEKNQIMLKVTDNDNDTAIKEYKEKIKSYDIILDHINDDIAMLDAKVQF